MNNFKWSEECNIVTNTAIERVYHTQRLVILMKQMFLFDVPKLSWNWIVCARFTRTLTKQHVHVQHASNMSRQCVPVVCAWFTCYAEMYVLRVTQEKIHRLKMAFAIHVCECVIYKKESIQKRNHSFFLFAWINKLSTLCCLFYANTWTEWQVVVVARVPVFGWMNGKCCCNQFMRLNMCETKVCHFEATTATTTSSNQLINFYFIHT